MHNWWIAAMEITGIWTRKQAEQVATEIKNHIHKESYPETVEELVEILEARDMYSEPAIHKLTQELNETKAQLEELKAYIDTKLAPKKKR